MLNKNRSKIVIYSLIGLATVALATVGFSGWIIDGSVDTNENVSVTVSEIADRTTVIEVLDSRIPLSSQNEYVERIVSNKPKLYVLTKIDLSDEKETKKWVDYFNQNGNKAIAINLKDNRSYEAIFKKIVEFCREKDEKYKKKGIKNISTRAMIIGIPNVGKSTLINYLAKKSLTDVANKPGLTKNVRWVKINTPGILEPQYENKQKALNLALIGSIKETILPKDQLATKINEFLIKYYKDEYQKRYDLDLTSTKLEDILPQIAKKRGFILKNNELDLLKATDTLINEFKNGIISKYTIERVS